MSGAKAPPDPAHGAKAPPDPAHGAKAPPNPAHGAKAPPDPAHAGGGAADDASPLPELRADPRAAPAAAAGGASAAGLRAWWQARAPREQALLALAAALVVMTLLVAVAVLPAWRTLQRAPAQIDAADAQLQSLQRLADEAQSLRATPPVGAAQSAAALRAATERLGAAGRLTLQGDRAVLTLDEVGTEALRGWLGEARSGARARPVEATLTRGARGYSGTLVVAFGSGA